MSNWKNQYGVRNEYYTPAEPEKWIDVQGAIGSVWLKLVEEALREAHSLTASVLKKHVRILTLVIEQHEEAIRDYHKENHLLASNLKKAEDEAVRVQGGINHRIKSLKKDVEKYRNRVRELLADCKLDAEKVVKLESDIADLEERVAYGPKKKRTRRKKGK